MKRVLLITGATMLVFVPLAAQETPKPATAAKDTVTLTGCLQAGTAPDTFTLSNVTEATAKSTATGTSGAATASATAGGKGTDTKYELSADTSVNLKPHVGHKVEITGTEDAKGAAGTAGTTGATASTSASSGAMGAAKKIKVTAIKHVAASCP